MGVTLRDVARHLGMSVTTVSDALNGGGRGQRVSTQTLERVREAARKLEYRPNRSARAIQSGRHGCVALLQSNVEWRSDLRPLLRAGIIETLLEHNIHMINVRLPDAMLTDEKFVPSILREWFADGLFVLYNSNVPQEMERLIDENHLPSVWINYRRSFDGVYPDDHALGREVTERLQQSGHERIAYIGWTGVSHYSSADRVAGYEAGMTAAGLTPEVFWSGDGSGLITLEEAGHILERSVESRPTAFFCYDERIAIRMLLAAARRGMEVPRDFSLICVNDSRSTTAGQEIDTMLLPSYEMGKMSVEMLLAKIDEPSLNLPSRSLRATYHAGQTVAPPPIRRNVTVLSRPGHPSPGATIERKI